MTTTTLPVLGTPAALAARLGIAEAPHPGSPAGKQWDGALRDASAELRRAIGQQISRDERDIVLELDERGEARFPMSPVIAVTNVRYSDGQPLEPSTYRVVGNRLRYHVGWSIRTGAEWISAHVVSGYDTIPDEIQKYVFVLAAAQLAAARRTNLGMTGGLESISSDDTRLGLTDAPIELPARIAEQLRTQYGGG